MIQRKMCNNATRKFPKNYDPMARQAQIEMDEVYQQTQAEIIENANQVDFEEVVEPQETKQELPEFMSAE